VRTALYATAIGAGALLAQLGDEPIWVVAVVALLGFPAAAAAALPAEPGPGRPPLAASLAAGLCGGVLAGLLIRLAVLAPDWVDAGTADCGGASEDTQRLVLWGAALLLVLAVLPVAAALLGVGSRIAARGPQIASRAPLALYPLAVAAAGLALIGASFVTSC
jgi:hypothetical protein